MRAGFSSDSVCFQLHGVSTVLRFPGSNPGARLDGEEEMAGKVNIFSGAQARTNLETYGRIRYRDLYPGIDLRYSGKGRRIKAEFLVAPGADPALIQLAYDGEVSIAADGSLMVRKQGAELREEAPVVLQDGHRIPGRYQLIEPHLAGFSLGAYDHSRALIIDPTITYSTYLGGTGMGSVNAVAVDASGDVYVAGYTEALNFPIVGAYQATNKGSVNAFVAKLSAAGTSLIYATYVGGNSDDRAWGIAVDSSGNAYVTGSTTSTNFPLVSSLHSTLGGGRDAFVFKLNSTGNTLTYSTLLGGSNEDWGYAIALDSSANAYIAGDTMSTDFPVSTGAAQTVQGGQTDAFVTKLTSTATVVFSTYLGGSGVEHAGGIAIDSTGNVYVAGGTLSTNFPTVIPIQAANAGGQDAFVTKIKSTGASLVYSTYLGGAGGTAGAPEQANGIAVDSSGNAYIAGVTPSTNFPVTSGALQAANNGGSDAFVAKIAAAGTSLAYSTYLGGTLFDQANGIAVDSSGDAYVAGYTASPNFVVNNAIQLALAGMYDAFVTELGPAGNTVMFSTYYGGAGSDEAIAIALDSSANIYLGGETGSANFPLTDAYQTVNNGGVIGWVARMGVTAPPPQLPTVGTVSPASGSGASVTFTATYSDPAGATALTNVALLVNSSASTSYGCYITYNVAANTFTLADDVPSSGSVTVLPNGGSGQNDQCTLNGTGSSATLSGTTLTMTISLVFSSNFVGNQNVYLWAQSATANTGWVSKGAWTVTAVPPAPSAVSVSPNSNTGASQTFQFVFADTQNPSNIVATAMLFAPSLSNLDNTCYIVYDAVHATVQLEYNALNGSSSKPVTSTSTLSNSQCSVGATSVTFSGLSLIFTASITFQGAFSGVQNIYMYAAEGSGTPNTGWVQNGTYTVAAGGIPVVNSAVPSSGTGPAERFSFTVSDAGGSSYITDVVVLFSTSSANDVNTCQILYDRIENVVALAYNNPASGTTEMQLGSSNVASNSQCSLKAATSQVVFGTTSVVLTLDIAFSSTFSGAVNTYVEAVEAAANTGWVQVGGWNVTGGAPTANSVTPASGAGSDLITYTFSASDSVNASNISNMAMLFTTGAPTNLANACYLVYNTAAATIGLYNNAGTVLSTKPVGSSASLENTQCAVGYSSESLTSGTTISVTVQLLFFTPGFDGAKTVYADAIEPASSSGWVELGTWTVQ